MTQENTGEDQTNQTGSTQTTHNESGSNTLPKLVFPDAGSKTYLRRPAFYVSSGADISKEQFEANIFSGDNLVAKVVFGASFECAEENSKKHYSRGELKAISGQKVTLAPGKYTIKPAAISGTTNAAATSPNTTLQPGTYTIELDESVLGLVDKTKKITFEIVHFLYPLPDMTVYEKRPRFFFDPEVLTEYWLEEEKSSPYRLQQNGTTIALIRPHDKAFYLEPKQDLRDNAEYKVYKDHELEPLFSIKSANANNNYLKNSQTLFEWFVDDLKHHIAGGFHKAETLWKTKKVRIKKEDPTEDVLFWTAPTNDSSNPLVINNDPENLKPKSSNADNFDKETLKLFRSGRLAYTTTITPPFFHKFDHYSKPFELAAACTISDWLTNKVNSYHMLVLHVIRPKLFPHSNKHMEKAATEIDAEWSWSNNAAGVTRYQSITAHIESLSDSNKTLAADVKALHEAGNWHADYCTDFFHEVSDSYASGNDIFALLKANPQVIFYGPPGTGKTWTAERKAEWLVRWEKFKGKCPASLSADNLIKRVQFHPGYAYEDFIEGYRIGVDASGNPQITIKEGLFKEFCREAGVVERLKFELEKNKTIQLSKEDKNLLKKLGGSHEICPKDLNKEALDELPQPTYILIIDEINRANLSNVFGECLYCLEYRGAEGAITLPHSTQDETRPDNAYAWDGTKDVFFVPTNVRIIGTMNTIDKSTESMDFALRRRFGWKKFDPNLHIMVRVLRTQGVKNVTDAKYKLEKINKRLETDLQFQSGDYKIGETYFYLLSIIEKAFPPVGPLPYQAKKILYHTQIRPVLEDYYAANPAQWLAASDHFTTDKDGPKFGSLEDGWMRNADNIWKMLQIKPQIILYGPPGTGKTWTAWNEVIHQERAPDKLREGIAEAIKVQFHPSYSYEDFLQGFRPQPAKEGKTGSSHLNYQLQDGEFKAFCRRAGKLEISLLNIIYGPLVSQAKDSKANPSCCLIPFLKPTGKVAYVTFFINPGKNIEVFANGFWKHFPIDGSIKQLQRDSISWVLEKTRKDRLKYVMLIDEINRAELAAVFGELMYCLEYRGPNGYIELPHQSEDKATYFAELNGKEVFFIPDNVQIIGTMNTIDRSTEPMDFAMRRRFSWMKFDPVGKDSFETILGIIFDSEGIDGEIKREISNIWNRFSKLNEQLEKDLQEGDYRVGQSYFYKVANVIRMVLDTCEPVSSIDKAITYGPVRGDHTRNGKPTIMGILFDSFIEPLLEDYFTLASNTPWKVRKQKYMNIVRGKEDGK